MCFACNEKRVNHMLGTIVNSLAIITGGLIGVLLKTGIKDNYKSTIMDGVALSVIVIGIINAIKSQNIILLISSLVIGGFIGEALAIESKLDQLGKRLELKLNRGENNFSKAFVSSSLIFCVGAMAIVGSLEAGIQGTYETLFAKSILEGISALVFATTLGIGVIFSSIPVFLYQGFITLMAGNLSGFLSPLVITEISAVGGVLIIGIGITLLDLKKIKVGNLLPAVLIPLIYYAIMNLINFI